MILAIGLVALIMASSNTAAFAQVSNNIPQARKDLALKIESIIDQMHSDHDAAVKASVAGDHVKLKQIASDYENHKKQFEQALGQLPKGNIVKMSSTPVVPKEISSAEDPVFNISGGQYGCDFNWDSVSGSGNAYTGTGWVYISANASPSMSTGTWPSCTTQQFAQEATVTVENLWTYDTAESTGYPSTTSPLVNQWFNYPYGFISGDPYVVIVTSYYANGNQLEGTGYVNP